MLRGPREVRTALTTARTAMAADQEEWSEWREVLIQGVRGRHSSGSRGSRTSDCCLIYPRSLNTGTCKEVVAAIADRFTSNINHEHIIISGRCGILRQAQSEYDPHCLENRRRIMEGDIVGGVLRSFP